MIGALVLFVLGFGLLERRRRQLNEAARVAAHWERMREIARARVALGHLGALRALDEELAR